MNSLAKITLLSFLYISSSFAQSSNDDLNILIVPAIIAANKDEAEVPVPVPRNRPGPSNTGPKGQLTNSSGSITVRQDGAIIESIDLIGCITIRANNVTIRNVRINCDGFYAIRMIDGFSGLRVDQAEMLNMKSAAILGSNFTVTRSNIHDSGADAFKPGRNVVIESSWMHRLGTIDGSHSDAVQMVAGGDVVIRGNNIDMPANLQRYTNSQCILLQTNNGPINNVLIENNWLNGGGWCVQVNDKERGHGSPQNIRISGNRFGPDCTFGTILVRGDNADTSVTDNIFELTGGEIGVDEPFSSCGNDFN